MNEDQEKTWTLHMMDVEDSCGGFPSTGNVKKIEIAVDNLNNEKPVINSQLIDSQNKINKLDLEWIHNTFINPNKKLADDISSLIKAEQLNGKQQALDVLNTIREEKLTIDDIAQTKTGAWCAKTAIPYWNEQKIENNFDDDGGIDIDSLEKKLMIPEPVVIDDPGIDLDELDIKQTYVSQKEIENALKDLKQALQKSIDSEEGIDLSLFYKIKEEKDKAKTILAKAEIEKQKLIKEQKRLQEQELNEELQFAKKRIEDCSSFELNKRTEEELLRKKRDEEYAKRISYINNRTEVSKETLKQFRSLLSHYEHPSVSRHFKEMKEIEE